MGLPGPPPGQPQTESLQTPTAYLNVPLKVFRFEQRDGADTLKILPLQQLYRIKNMSKVHFWAGRKDRTPSGS